MTFPRRDTIFINGDVYYPAKNFRDLFRKGFVHPLGREHFGGRTDCWDGFLLHLELDVQQHLRVRWMQVDDPGEMESVPVPSEVLSRIDCFNDSYAAWPCISIVGGWAVPWGTEYQVRKKGFSEKLALKISETGEVSIEPCKETETEEDRQRSRHLEGIRADLMAALRCLEPSSTVSE
jgi:hypothetical protein